MLHAATHCHLQACASYVEHTCEDAEWFETVCDEGGGGKRLGLRPLRKAL